jgi:hypothetical protein
VARKNENLNTEDTEQRALSARREEETTDAVRAGLRGAWNRRRGIPHFADFVRNDGLNKSRRVK